MGFSIPIYDSMMYPIEVFAIELRGDDKYIIRTRARIIRGKDNDKTIVIKLVNGEKITVTSLKDLYITGDWRGNPKKFVIFLRKVGMQYVPIKYSDGELRAPNIDLLQTYIIEEEKRQSRWKPPLSKADLLVNLMVIFAVVAIALSMYFVLQELQKLIPMLGSIMEANSARLDWIIANMNKTASCIR